MAFSFKSKKTLFSATAKKASFGLEKLIICFPVRLCVRDKLRAEVQTFWKTHNFLLSIHRTSQRISPPIRTCKMFMIIENLSN